MHALISGPVVVWEDSLLAECTWLSNKSSLDISISLSLFNVLFKSLRLSVLIIRTIL